jgi:type VI secretion system protein VasL
VVLKVDSRDALAPRKRRALWPWLLLLGLLIVLAGLIAWARAQGWQAVRVEPAPPPAPQAVRLDGQLLFPPGKAELRPESAKVLVNSLIDIKAQPGWLIVITGHSDSTGDARRNLELSRDRAAAVREWMQGMGDIPDDCFEVRGVGDSQPVASDETEEGRNANRRVEIILTPEGGACRTAGEPPQA